MAQNVYRPDSSTGKDAHIDSFNNGTNYGNVTGPLIGLYNGGKDEKKWRFLVDFDISDILGATVAATSKLGIWALDFAGTPSDHNFEWRRITQAAWTELGVTWDDYDGVNAWTAGGGDYSTPVITAVGPASSGAMWELTGVSVQSMIQDALDNRSGILRLICKRQNEGDSLDINFATVSCEGAAAAQRPTLTVDYTPAAPGPVAVPILSSQGAHSLVFGGQVITGGA